MTPACSVVIPSRNRATQLDLVLCALAAQVTDQPFEVVVVLDGSTDDSAEICRTWERVEVFSSFRWTERARGGAATARNVGSMLATAPVFLFLDDDVIPDPDLISRHLAHHAEGKAVVVLGDCEMVRGGRYSLAELVTWMWWEDTYARRAAPWQPASYRDFCTGNVSVRREDFARVGGFDHDFVGYGGEDYELGYRLLRSGVRFISDRDAHARHLKTTSVKQKLVAVRQEARGDVLMAQKHPELISGLRLASAGSKARKAAAALAMYAPWVGLALCFALRPVLIACERVKMRRRWLRTFGFLEAFYYWRGLHDVMPSMRALRGLRRTALPPFQQQLDIAKDLGPQVQTLNIDVPGDLLIVNDGAPVVTLRIGPHITQPFLGWLVDELSTAHANVVLVELAGKLLPSRAVREGARRFLEGSERGLFGTSQS